MLGPKQPGRQSAPMTVPLEVRKDASLRAKIPDRRGGSEPEGSQAQHEDRCPTTEKDQVQRALCQPALAKTRFTLAFQSLVPNPGPGFPLPVFCSPYHGKGFIQVNLSSQPLGCHTGRPKPLVLILAGMTRWQDDPLPARHKPSSFLPSAPDASAPQPFQIAGPLSKALEKGKRVS